MSTTTKKGQKVERTLNYSGKCQLYKGDYGFSLQFSKKHWDAKRKKETEEYDKFYVPVTFKNDSEPKCKNKEVCQIEIIESFFSVYITKNDVTGLKLVVTEYEQL